MNRVRLTPTDDEERNELFKTVLVRYGELSLKGRNRHQFEDRLLQTMRRTLRDVPHGTIQKTYGRMYVETRGDWRAIIERLQTVFGIVSLSPVATCELNLEAIKGTALQVLQQAGPRTFKVQTRRPNKEFRHNTPAINEAVGAHLLENTEDLRVDVHNPEVTVYIEVRREGVYVYSAVYPGLGGLPVGTAGRGLLLLSGGIDSPVAGFLTMKRGVEVQALHFHSYPFTSERAQQKAVELARQLAHYAEKGTVVLHSAHFTEIQKALQKNPYPEQKITVMRRMMLRIAERIAVRQECLALVTGESLGQVASQTLESMYTINAVTNMPVLRPLVGMDKQEIIERARSIGTYDTSILPYEDCCTLFVPKNPAIRPTKAEAELAEESLDIDELVEEAVARTESTEVSYEIQL